MQFIIYLVNIDNHIYINNFQYSICFPKSKVKLEDTSKVIVFLDIKVEINIITIKMIEDARLAIKKIFKFEHIYNVIVI